MLAENKKQQQPLLSNKPVIYISYMVVLVQHPGHLVQQRRSCLHKVSARHFYLPLKLLLLQVIVHAKQCLEEDTKVRQGNRCQFFLLLFFLPPIIC